MFAIPTSCENLVMMTNNGIKSLVKLTPYLNVEV